MQATTAIPSGGEDRFVIRDLFGGAIRCQVPKEYVDVSDFRVVPDNQECFANPNTDRSVLVDILEFCPEGPEGLYKHIAEMNDADEPGMSTVIKVEKLDATVVPQVTRPETAPSCSASGLLGVQKVVKFHEASEARNTVLIYMGNIRLPQFETDIVITHNVPTEFDPRSSSATSCFVPNEESPGLNEFLHVMRTFEIRDVGLFTPSTEPHELVPGALAAALAAQAGV